MPILPTIGHALAIAQLTRDPKRVGCLIESAHAILAGLDPADEIDFAMTFGKLWSLAPHDQNGLKFDQDKPFGSANLRVAFNQVRALERNGYGKNGRIRLLRRSSLPYDKSRALAGAFGQQPAYIPAVAAEGSHLRREDRPAARGRPRLRRARPDGAGALDGRVAHQPTGALHAAQPRHRTEPRAGMRSKRSGLKRLPDLILVR